MNLPLAEIGQTHDYLVSVPNAHAHDERRNNAQQTHTAHDREWCQRPEQFAYSLPRATDPLSSNDTASHLPHSQVDAHPCHLSSHPSPLDTSFDTPAFLSEPFNIPVSGSAVSPDPTRRALDYGTLRQEGPYHPRPEGAIQGIEALSPLRILYPHSETQTLVPRAQGGTQSHIPWLDPYVPPRDSQLNYPSYDATEYTLSCSTRDYSGTGLVPPQCQVWPSSSTSSSLEGSSTSFDLLSLPTASPDAQAVFASGGTHGQDPQSPAVTTPNGKRACPLCGTSAIKLTRHMRTCRKNPDKVFVQCKRCGGYLCRSDNMGRHQTTSKCKIGAKKLAKAEGCCSPPPYPDLIQSE